MGKRGRFCVVDGGGKWARADDYPPGSSRRRGGWGGFVGLWLGAILVGSAVGYGLYSVERPDRAEAVERLSRAAEAKGVWAAEPLSLVAESAGVRAQFDFCHTGGGTNCVVDGDTIWLQGQNIRIADIDAPETHEPLCPEEKALGDRATQRLLQLVNSGTVTLEPIDRDEDRFGRKLRIVKVDRVSVGDTLVDEGLARWYRGGKRSWC